MTTSCIITKKGLKTVKWNSKLRKYETFDCKNPIIHINHTCEIDKGVTFKDVMKIGQNEVMSAIIRFYSDVNDIDAFHKELRKPLKKKIKLGFSYLEIFRSGDIFNNTFSPYVDFHGVKAKETCKYCNNPKYPDHGHYLAFDFTPLNEIANAKIKLNKRFIVREEYDKIVLDMKCDFTLMDILHAIYYEISFWGNPKDRDIRGKDLTNTVKNIKSGKEKTLSAKEVFND